MLARVSRKPTTSARSFSTTQQKNASATPLSQYFPGTPDMKGSAPEPAMTRKTTLDNGLTIVTRNVTGAPISNLSLFVEAGSRYEDKSNAGTSHFIAQLGFKDTTVSSELLRVRLLESTGADVSVSAGRENITYNLEGLSGAVPTVVGDFFEALYPRLHRLDVDAEREDIKHYIEDFVSSPDLVVNEALHQVAFGSKTLGNHLVCPPHNTSLSNKALVDFMNKLYTPDRMTLVALNYNHDELVGMTKEALGSEKRGSNVQRDTASYVGGEVMMNELRVAHPEENLQTHLAIGFQGSSFSGPNYATFAVLQSILGNGASSYRPSTRGSGSRLANVAASTGGRIDTSAFNMAYSDAGIFGVHAVVDPKVANKAVNAIAGEIANTASSVSEAEVARAKAVAKFNFLSSIEQRNATVDAIYRQSRMGEVDNDLTNAIVKQIDAVDVPTVKRVAEEMLKSTPSYVAYGDLSNLPDARDIAKTLS